MIRGLPGGHTAFHAWARLSICARHRTAAVRYFSFNSVFVGSHTNTTWTRHVWPVLYAAITACLPGGLRTHFRFESRNYQPSRHSFGYRHGSIVFMNRNSCRHLHLRPRRRSRLASVASEHVGGGLGAEADARGKPVRTHMANVQRYFLTNVQRSMANVQRYHSSR